MGRVLVRGVVCLFLERMAEAAAAKKVEEGVDAYLKADRNGVRLQGVLVAALMEYLMGTLAVKDVSTDLPQTLEEWVGTAHDAFKEVEDKELPGSLERRLRRWLAGREPSDADVTLAAAGGSPAKTFGSGGATISAGPEGVIASELGVAPSVVADDFDDVQITPHTREKAVSDVKKQGMLP